MENFFQRLDVYTEVAPSSEMMDVSMKIMVEVLTILAIAKQEIKQGRTSELFMYKYIAADRTAFRAVSQEVGRKDGYRRCAEEVGHVDQ